MSVLLPPDPPVAPLVPMPPWPPHPPLPSGPSWREDRTVGTKAPLLRAEVADPEQKLDLWYGCRAAHPRTGWWPLLVGEGFWETVEFEADDRPAAAFSAADWLQNRLTGPDRLVDHLLRGQRPTGGSLPEREQLALFAEEAESIVLVPAPVGWLVPEILNWEGAVNHGFGGPEHTLVLRRWAGYFGAELVGMTLDEVVLRLERPPAWPAAELAAYEAAAYCEDAVLQGTVTLDQLVPMIESQVWRFWWD